MSSSKIVFTNAKLVGHPAEETYNVVVKDGLVDDISRNTVDTTGAKIIDLAGESSWLSPSIVDHHTHFKWWAMATRRLNFYSARSAQEVLDMVQEALLNPRFDSAKDPLLVGQHMRVGTWTDLDKMCRESLDELSKERPIFLVFAGFHSMCMNSAGLRHVGVDPQGHSGVLEEQPAFEAQARLFEMGDDIMDPWVAEAAQAAA
jgi:predicted amidohydrolase YtcJ